MILAVIAVLLPMVVYVLAGFSKQAKARTPADFLIGGKTIGQNDYANTSVGYALQMAAVFLFASWGILYGIGALWAAVFWGLGYLLLYFLLPRLLHYHGLAEPLTLHEYLRVRFGAGRSLQLLAAGATIVGLTGTMLVEVDYVVQVLQPVSVAHSWATPVTLQAMFLLAGLSYIIWNGFKAEVLAERIQVPLAYCCLLITLMAILPGVWRHAGPNAFYPIVTVLACALLMMILGKVDLLARLRQRKGTGDWQIVIPIGGLLVLIVLILVITSAVPGGNAPSVFAKPISFQLKAQGFLGVASLFLANVFWMPVDLSTWQRIASVRDTNVLQVLKGGTLRVALESPAGWVLGAVLGWSIHASGILDPAGDAFTAIPAFAAYLFAGSVDAIRLPIGSIVYATFLAGSVAVMLSTVNSIMSAIAYTVERDLLVSGRETLTRLRLVTACSLILGFVAFEGLRKLAGANLSILLYGAYSAQLALLVVVFIALFDKRLSARGALGSIALGLGASLSYVFLAIHLNDPRGFVLPPMFAIAGAILGYALFYKPVTDSPVDERIPPVV